MNTGQKIYVYVTHSKTFFFKCMRTFVEPRATPLSLSLFLCIDLNEIKCVAVVEAENVHTLCIFKVLSCPSAGRDNVIAGATSCYIVTLIIFTEMFQHIDM